MSAAARQPTNFEQRVYDMLGKIPRGKVVTYAEMARVLDCGSAQAIGQALKRNPYAPEVACHRVIKTD
ncbi:MAG: MGMT family protein, partial [Akkermansiaceae bacterium]